MREKQNEPQLRQIFKNIENLFFKLGEVGNKCAFSATKILETFRISKIKEFHNAKPIFEGDK